MRKNLVLQAKSTPMKGAFCVRETLRDQSIEVRVCHSKQGKVLVLQTFSLF
jgi:hypothetical protein